MECGSVVAAPVEVVSLEASGLVEVLGSIAAVSLEAAGLVEVLGSAAAGSVGGEL